MIRTPACDLLSIETPIIQGSLGPWTSAELTAAVSNAGGLGSLGTAMLSPDALQALLARMRDLTNRPYAINHTMRPFNPETFDLTLRARPRVISLAHGDPGDLARRAHDAGCVFMHMITTVQEARQGVERGADVIIAQGSESAGFGGTVSTMALLPQVIDAVSPIPVIASGGIADGRGFAAALLLGAQGINIGTRFLASLEATVSDDWKRALLAAQSEDAVKVDFADEVFPPAAEGGYKTQPRALRTAWIDEWNRRRDDVKREAPRLREELLAALQQGRGHELVPLTGQTVGMIREILPVAEIIRRMTSEAEDALRRAPRLLG